MRRSSVPLLVTLVAVMVKFGCGRGSFLSVHCIVTPYSKDSSLSMQKFAPIGYTRLWLGRSVYNYDCICRIIIIMLPHTWLPLMQYLLGIAGSIITGEIPAVLFNSANREEQHEIATQP